MPRRKAKKKKKGNYNLVPVVAVLFVAMVMEVLFSGSSGYSGGNTSSELTVTIDPTITISAQNTTITVGGGGGGGGGGHGSSTTSTSHFSSTTTRVTTSSTSTRTTLTTSTITGTTSTCTSSCPNGNLFWNANSQKVADLVVQYGWHSDVQMFSDINEPGCNDYVGGLPCDNTMWTTSNNVPLCWTLGDFGYSSIMNQCITKLNSLGAFNEPRNGMRYEAFVGTPIISGNACCIHTILQPNGNDVQCPQTGCSGYSWGTDSQGLYNLQSDAWNGKHKGTVITTAGVDIAASQAINAWLRGDKATFTTIENNLIADYTSTNYVNTGSTWQLGQVLFVMRVGGQDGTNAFKNMVNMLWSLQDSSGYLPNTYNAQGGLGGHDAENMDAGLLPFCYSCVVNIQNNFGTYNLNSAPT